MGRRSRTRNLVGDVITALSESHRDVIEIRSELDTISMARSEQWFFDSTFEFAACVVTFIAVYIFGTLAASMGRCILDLEPSNSTIPLAINSCVLDQVGFIVLMGFLIVVTLQFKSVIRSYQRKRMDHIERRESILKHRVMVVFLRLACKISDVSLPSRLNYDQYLGTVVDVLANSTAILAPLVALFWPGWGRYFRFTSAIGFVSKSWDRLYSSVKAAWNWLFSGERPTYQKVGAVAAISAALGAASWYGFGRFYRKNGSGSLRVVPKRKQRVYTENPPVRPLDPSELKFVANTEQSYSSSRTFPEHPTFNGVSVVERSIVRINGQYAATAFRVGNNLVTAMHCIGRDESFPGDGIACYNPDDNKYYWAPLEKCFRNKSPIVGGDGVAVCALPNADFFLTRHSTQLAVPNSRVSHAGAYRLQNPSSGKPNYTFSIGPCDVEQHLLSFKAAVEPGSSGGPIINPDGSVIAITVGHTQFTNYGLLVTDEIRDFLVKGGDAQPSSSATHTQSQSDSEYTSTASSDESSTEEDEPPKTTGVGPAPTPKKKSKPSKDSNGVTKNAGGQRVALRRKKKQQGVGPPAPGDHIESSQPTTPPPPKIA